MHVYYLLLFHVLVVLASLVKDLASVKSKYMEFGVQLGIPMGTIESFKVDYNNDSGKIFHQIIHYLLTNTPESLWFEKVCSALEGVDNKVLANTVKSTYMKTSLTGTVIYLFSHSQ